MIVHKEYFSWRYIIKDFQITLREIRNLINRMKYGYGHVDTFDLGHYFLVVFSKALREFNEYNFGYPPGLTMEEWKSIIKDIADGFEAKEKQYYEWGNTKESREAEKKYNKAIKLFCKWHRDLWW